MEAKTKKEREVVAIRDSLKPITDREKVIGYRKAFWYSGTQYANGKCICRECGHSWERNTKMWDVEKSDKGRMIHKLKPGNQYEITTCPNCRKRIHAYAYFSMTHGSDQGYFAILQCVGKYQIIRIFETMRHWWHGVPAKYEYIGEVAQRYIDMQKGEVAVDLARHQNGLKGAYSRFTYWRYDTEMTVKCRHSTSYLYGGYNTDKYDFACAYIARTLHPILERAKFRYLPWAKADYMIACIDPHAATLIEAKQFALFELYEHGGKDYWPQMKICIRNRYKVTDYTLWRDTIQNLRYLGMDDHSPKYLCPDNLKQLHDQTQRRRDRIEAARRRKEKLKDLARSEKAYAKFIERYKDIKIEGSDLVIYPLPSVTAFYDEGEAMKHCVFSHEYYKDRRILILSARDSKGERLATIEYELKDGNIRQCRAKCNNTPLRNLEIRELITRNRKVFLNHIKPQKQTAI